MRARTLRPSWVGSYDPNAVMREMMANHTLIPAFLLPLELRPHRKRESREERQRQRERDDFFENDRPW